MARVPRQEFVPYELRPYAYFDGPLPIGFEKTISQPFIAALMTDLLDVRDGHRVLEVGTGLGYHAAVLAERRKHWTPAEPKVRGGFLEVYRRNVSAADTGAVFGPGDDQD